MTGLLIQIDEFAALMARFGILRERIAQQCRGDSAGHQHRNRDCKQDKNDDDGSEHDVNLAEVLA